MEKARIREVNDFFNVSRISRHVGYATPSERLRLPKYVRNYLRKCERHDAKLPCRKRSLSVNLS